MSLHHRLLFVGYCCLMHLAPLPAGRAWDPIFSFEVGDRIAIVGNALADRMQHDGWLETRIQARFPKHRLRFRNLGFNGDTVSTRLRSPGFGSPEEWLQRTEASVVFAFFGYNESFEDTGGMAQFKAELSKYLHHTTMHPVGKRNPPRVVLFSPIAHEDLASRFLPSGEANNARLEDYTQAMEEVAHKHRVPFVDLFHPTYDLFHRSTQRWTINGIHLTERGNHKLAQIICDRMFGEAPSKDEDTLQGLRASVVEKNSCWFHRYRTTDGYSVFGGRKNAGGSKTTPRNEPVMRREMEILDVMTANRDERIWAVSNGGDMDINDANTPEFIPVATNRRGPNDDGTYSFLTGEESLGKLTVPQNMQVNLFASEEDFPELQNPVQLAFDTRGRLWVAVWPSYPHWKPKDPMNDKLLILEDTDGDGKADICKTFADGLHNPTGFEFYNGGVYVAQVPDIWFMQDVDGDDAVDTRERILGGIDSADTHHSINSFVVGPGGGLYFQEGLFHRTQIETPYGPPVRCNNGALFRFEPKTHKLGVQASFAFPNPHGHVFTYWGQNIVHDGTGARPFLGASFSGHTNFPDKHPRPPRIYQQRTRPCSGTAILSSSHFPETNRDTLLVCNVIGFQGVLQYRLSADGAGLRGSEIEPLLHSTDRNFRPSDVEVGGDGAVYVLDWHNPLIGHLQHNLRDSNRDHLHGRVYRITHKDRAPLTSLPMPDMSVAELVRLLQHRDNNIRYRARLELTARDSDTVLDAVRTWSQRLRQSHPDHEHRLLETLWMFQQHHVVNESLLERVLSSSDFRARAAAVRVLRAWREALKEPEHYLRKLVHDEHPRVRLEAVLVCSDIPSATAAEFALEVARYPRDRFLEFVLKEAVKTLAVYWKPQLASDIPVAPGNTEAVSYLLDHVGPEELVKLRPNPTVFRALLTREGIDPVSRKRALLGLSALQNTNPFDLLLQTIRQQPHVGTADLAGLLATWDPEELERNSDTLNLLATDSDQPAVRQAAMAALARSGVSVEQIWRLAESRGTLEMDVVRSLLLIPEPELRVPYHAKIRELLFRAQPRASLTPRAGISYTYYEQDVIPDVRLETVNQWRPVKVGRLEEISLAIPGARHDNWAVKLSASLEVKRRGKYVFFLKSNDGSRLYLNEQLVIDNDGAHKTTAKRGSIELTPGSHQFHLTYAHRKGAPHLTLLWRGPGIKKGTLTKDVFRSPESSMFAASMDALLSIPGHDIQTFHDLATLTTNRQARDRALAALRRVPESAWQAESAGPLTRMLLDRFANTPAAERTAPDFVSEFAFARQLSSLLPASDRILCEKQLEHLSVKVVRIETVPHRMAYDVTNMVTKAGSHVQFVLHNRDNMPHNFVLVRPGAMERVGILGERTANDADVVDRQYVPDSGDVLVASNLLQPQTGQTLTFQIPHTVGIYPYVCTYPGHWRRMFGALHVVDDVAAYESNPEAYLTANNIGIRDALLAFNRPAKAWTWEELLPTLKGLGSGQSFARGETLFSVANCVACHKYHGRGNRLGPDLTQLDKTWKADEVLRHILEPSKRIHDKFQTYSFVLKSGRIVTGLVTNEDTEQFMVVVDPLANPRPMAIRKDELDEIPIKSMQSQMPSGLLDRLTADEILELLAYVLARGETY